MVTKTAVKTSNAKLQNRPPIIAVFAGATSGIALNAMKALAKQATDPKVYLIGRSRAKAVPLLAELNALNPKGTFEFIEASISLLHDVEAACKIIKEKEKYIDLLVLSAGGLSLAGREETSEGLDTFFSLSYYSRMRFTITLLPLLNASPNSPRVVSILGAGMEGAINVEDLDLKNNYSMINEATHGGTMTSLVFDKLASENPHVSFLHTYPGFVKTDLMDKMFGSMTGWWAYLGTLARWLVVPIVSLFGTTPEEAGEMALFEATNDMYKGEGTRGAFYRVQSNGDVLKEMSLLQNYKTDGTQAKVWKDLMDQFDRISARS